MDTETKKLLEQILKNQNTMSLMIRRLIPFGENASTPILLGMEKLNKELIDNLK